MNDLQIFTYQSNQVRTVQQDGEPWFVLKDVCEVLELTTPARVSERLDEDEVSQTHITDSLGRQQDTTIVNESGLYHVILRSDKPQAGPFRKWVTSEVLPTIRKYGAYMTEETLHKALTSPDFLIQLATELKDEQDKNHALNDRIQKNAPKVFFADAVSTSHTSILVGEMAKLIKQNGVNIGQNRLFEFLRSNGYLISRSGSDYNMPTQRSMERGWFKIKERTISEPNGSVSIKKTTMVTGKGQQYFVNLFLSNPEGAAI